MKEKEENILKGRITDLMERAMRQDIYTFTDFMGLSEQSVFHSLKKEAGLSVRLFGGVEGAERLMARFGDSDRIGYEKDFPICCLEIESAAGESAFTHRDVLGALMNLGIKREMLGDIIIRDGKSLIFCKDSVCEFIIENLIKIRHDTVLVSRYDGNLSMASPRLLSSDIQVASLRLDAFLAKAFKIKRQEASRLISEKRAFINGVEIKNDSKSPKEGDIISLRGHGRVRFLENAGSTKKGNLILRIEKFV